MFCSYSFALTVLLFVVQAFAQICVIPALSCLLLTSPQDYQLQILQVCKLILLLVSTTPSCSITVKSLIVANALSLYCRLMVHLRGNFMLPSAQRARQKIGRLRFTFTPNRKREFVPRDQVFSLFFVYCLLLIHKNKQFYASFIHKNRSRQFFPAYFLF